MRYTHWHDTYYTNGKETIDGDDLYKRFRADWLNRREEDITESPENFKDLVRSFYDSQIKDRLGFHFEFFHWAEKNGWEEEYIYNLKAAAHEMRRALFVVIPYLRQAGIEDSIVEIADVAFYEGSQALKIR